MSLVRIARQSNIHDADSDKPADDIRRVVAWPRHAGEEWDGFDFAADILQCGLNSRTDARVTVEFQR